MSEKASVARNEVSPIFIVGVPRSGTTLMQSLLAAHPRIAIAPETHFLNSFVPSMNGESLNESSFEKFWTMFTRSDRFRGLALDEAAVRNSIVQSADYSYRNIFSVVLREYAALQGKERFGEKTPYHLAHLGRLLEWFPAARVIYMMRDPRAVCASLMSVWWRGWERKGIRAFEPRTMTRLRRAYHDSIVWQSQVEVFQQEWRRDPRVREIRYESVVTRPQETLKEICGFLNESFYPEMVKKRSRQKVADPVVASGRGRKGTWRKAHLERAGDRISTRSVEKWRSELSSMEIHTIESMCRPGMRWLDYPIGEQPLGLPTIIKSSLVKAWCRTYWRMEELSRALHRRNSQPSRT